jgi:hypothetical protein
MSPRRFTSFPECVGAFKIALVIISICGVPFLVSRCFPQDTLAKGSFARLSNGQFAARFYTILTSI